MNYKNKLSNNSSSEPKPEEKENTQKSEDIKNKKLDPTRYGDWEVKGIAVDF